MKKIICLVLAMVLCLTSVCAFAAQKKSPDKEKLIDDFTIDTSKTEFKPDDITKGEISEESKKLTEKITEGRKDTNNIGDIDVGKPIVFTDGDADIENPEKGKGMTNFQIVPFPNFTVGGNVADGEIGKIIIPLNQPTSEYLLNNLDKMNIYFMYDKGDTIKSYKIPEWYVISTSKTTKALLGLIPVKVLRDAQQYPMCLDFEIIEK